MGGASPCTGGRAQRLGKLRLRDEAADVSGCGDEVPGLVNLHHVVPVCPETRTHEGVESPSEAGAKGEQPEGEHTINPQ